MLPKTPRPLELLAPARDVSVARQAILHGADAVYIGASSHGARSAATNTIEEIAELVKFAHQFRARVYVTVNTIIYNSELEQVRQLISKLYRAQVDSIIVQDMAVLEMDIPPIQLHASTQCDITTPEKARFLQDVGFSQIVLARELSLKEIRKICQTVDVPVECFIHGALCVSYSGRCHASQACGGRSANRGECSQMCRLPYTLTDSTGKIISKDKYLLSLHDFNTSHTLKKLVDAGVSSFKIEGRLKDAAYVKNITALYRQLLDEIISRQPELYCRSSYGESSVAFSPDAAKSFNRGFTDFCLTNPRNDNLVSLHTPKSLGEKVEIKDLNNGDGISWLENGIYTGSRINKIVNGKIQTADNKRLPPRAHLRRTFDVKWEQTMARETGKREILVDMVLDVKGLTLRDERGVSARVRFELENIPAKTTQNRRPQFEKLGNTIYKLGNFTDLIPENCFIPNSTLATLRRNGIEALDIAAECTYPFHYRAKEDEEALFPSDVLDYRANVANEKAEYFYRRHGVKNIEPALEISGKSADGKTVMTSRHCILRQLGMCRRKNPKMAKECLTISNGRDRFRIETDCDLCEMRLVKLPK